MELNKEQFIKHCDAVKDFRNERMLRISTVLHEALMAECEKAKAEKRPYNKMEIVLGSAVFLRVFSFDQFDNLEGATGALERGIEVAEKGLGHICFDAKLATALAWLQNFCRDVYKHGITHETIKDLTEARQ